MTGPLTDFDARLSQSGPAEPPAPADAPASSGEPAAPGADAPDGADPPWRRAILQGLWVWLASRIGLVLVSLVSWIGTVHPKVSLSDIARRWSTAWDSGHFLYIAAHGYTPSHDNARAAFFPVYPALIRLLTPVTLGHDWLAALLISNLATFAALALLYRLTEHEFDGPVAGRTIFYLVAFPTGMFLTVAYNESLLLALAVAAVYAMRLRRWWLAGVLAFFATATRSTGALLAVPFCYEYLRLHRWRIRPSVLAVGLIPLGIAPIMIITSITMHDPLAFSHAQSAGWGRHLDWPWVAPYHTAKDLLVNLGPQRYGLLWAHDFLELGSVLLLLALIVLSVVGPWRLRRDQLLYPLFALVMTVFVAIFPNTDNPYPLYSADRLALEVFPAFMILARIGRHPLADRLILVASIGIQGVLVMEYLHGGWVA